MDRWRITANPGEPLRAFRERRRAELCAMSSAELRAHLDAMCDLLRRYPRDSEAYRERRRVELELEGRRQSDPAHPVRSDAWPS